MAFATWSVWVGLKTDMPVRKRRSIPLLFGLFVAAQASIVQAELSNNERIEPFEMRHPAYAGGLGKPKILSIYGGGSYGAESPILGFPALEIRIRPFRDFSSASGFYIGGKASAWFIISGVLNVGLESGFQYRKVTLDASLTYSELASWESNRGEDGGGGYEVGPAKKLTLNPKIGFSHSILSLKVGPSFKLRDYLRDVDRKNQDSPELLRYFIDDDGLTSVNVELGIGTHWF